MSRVAFFAALRRPAVGARVALAALAAFAGVVTMPAIAAAQTQIASAVAVIPAAFGQLGTTEVQLIEGAELYEGQVIRTNANGEVQIIFADDTRMVVGPNSALVIERYLMRSPNTVSDMTLNALGGTFRFITGNSAKEAYTIETPTGTIGIRGTEFDFNVSWVTGRADFLVYFGSIFICSDGGDCVVLTEECTVGSVIEINDAALISSRGDLQRMATREFRYLASQGGLNRDFRVGNRVDCLQALLDEQPAEPVVAQTPPPQPQPPPPANPPPANPPPAQPPSNPQPANPPPANPPPVQPPSNPPVPQPDSDPPAPPPPPPPEPPAPEPPTPEPPSEPSSCENNNAGLGNGPECPSEGDAEAENPGNGGGNNGHGPGGNIGDGPGNGNGNGLGNNNGNGGNGNGGNGPGDGNGPGGNNGNHGQGNKGNGNGNNG